MSRANGLRVWHAAQQLSNDVAKLCTHMPRGAPAGLRGQLADAAGSIADNIAEGAGRGMRGEKLQSFRHARGSLEETQSQLQRCRDNVLVDEETYQRLQRLSATIGKMLGSLMAKLERG